jgi:hypothetical protein
MAPETPAQEEAVSEDAVVDPSVREAALAAIQEAGLDESNWPIEEAPHEEGVEPDPTTPAATEEVEEAEEESEAPAAEDDSVEAPEEDASVPTEWFGVDLSGLPSEKRAEIISHYKDQDRYAQSLAKKLAEKPDEAEEPPEPEAELDDDQLMEALGVSQDDPMYDVKKEIQAPLARIIAQQQAVLQQVQERDSEQQFISWWDGGLDEMEAQFGPLSINREDLAQIALKEGLRSPQEAYARVALSGRKTVEDLVTKAKAATKEKVAKPKPSTQRPRGDAAATKPPSKNMTPKEAAEAAAKSLGFDWGDSLKGVT